MRKVIEAQKSKEVFSLEDCVSSNLKKMLYRIPEFTVDEFSDRYVITIKPNNADMKTIGSAAAIKRWVKASGVPFSSLRCGKMAHDRLGNELWCEVYKAKNVSESVDKKVQKSCNLILNMIDELNNGVRNKIKQIKTLDDTQVKEGQLDDLAHDLDIWMSKVMKLKV